ncbi:MAG: HAMP domain-containing protein [Anaerolineaceae bacterium]|nr:MAG: HAMP domain-containing protein [Anaerolineaceae bacterium]
MYFVFEKNVYRISMKSINLKLILGFLAIGFASISSIVLLARQNTRDEFNRFVAFGHGEDLTAQLANYYETYGSWDGAQEAVTSEPPPAKRSPSFTIADENGYALFDGVGFHAGDLIPGEELDFGIPITIEDKTVGILIMERTPFPGTPREEEFIQRINLFFLYSGLGVALFALLLGILLSRTISRPIRELTRATHAVSEGDLDQQVPVRSRDEIGELARAFNKMSAELSRSVNARRQMTADIAHELRTPLSLILGHAEAIHDGVLPPSPENFEIIREEAARLDHLVDDLRTLSLADAGELTIQPQTISPARLLEEVATLYRFQTQTKNLSIDLDIASSLPDLEVDPGRMTQVITNILDNAVRHTPEGGTITLAARGTSDGVALSVRDSGPGLSTDDLPRIFDRFYRADESRVRYEGGSGLGLAIAKSIVLAHGGQVRAESEQGKGLEIIITLPAKR